MPSLNLPSRVKYRQPSPLPLCCTRQSAAQCRHSISLRPSLRSRLAGCLAAPISPPSPSHPARLWCDRRPRRPLKPACRTTASRTKSSAPRTAACAGSSRSPVAPARADSEAGSTGPLQSPGAWRWQTQIQRPRSAEFDLHHVARVPSFGRSIQVAPPLLPRPCNRRDRKLTCCAFHN